MRTGQQEFWNYDFSYIPVELLSGLYEAFLSPEQQAKDGAYYTPRNLAVLAVDQAFDTSADPLSETILDGACGSGILLTTAYRRMIAIGEAREGRQLGFAERTKLLTHCIFGGDINPMACRVTAFSLYLSLLEGLAPADILAAQERENAKLPCLKDRNLLAGADAADFLLRTTVSAVGSSRSSFQIRHGRSRKVESSPRPMPGRSAKAFHMCVDRLQEPTRFARSTFWQTADGSVSFCRSRNFSGHPALPTSLTFWNDIGHCD